MKYISTPLTLPYDAEASVKIVRDMEDRKSMLDNLVELIIFTPRGSFNADPDFGFEYWNHEYANVHYREFNNDHTGITINGLYNEVTKKECQESIRQSLATYAPHLTKVNISIELDTTKNDMHRRKNIPSKYIVTIIVEGIMEDGLGTTCPYRKDVSFMMEPTAKKYKI